MKFDTTVCVLFYGDHPDLARRVLTPLRALFREGVEFRVGCNEVSDRTLGVLAEFFGCDRMLSATGTTKFHFGDELDHTFYAHRPQIFKYPLMRRLFWDDDGVALPLHTKYVMWFDDDSYLTTNRPVDWLEEVEQFMKNCDLAGDLWFPKPGLSMNQCAWAASRPWANGKQVRTGHKPRFATGGWWIARTEMLREYDWPDPDISHNGGDVMLGLLMELNGRRLAKFNHGVAINADAEGRNSRAKRRGYSGPPVGSGYRNEEAL